MRRRPTWAQGYCTSKTKRSLRSRGHVEVGCVRPAESSQHLSLQLSSFFPSLLATETKPHRLTERDSKYSCLPSPDVVVYEPHLTTSKVVGNPAESKNLRSQATTSLATKREELVVQRKERT